MELNEYAAAIRERLEKNRTLDEYRAAVREIAKRKPLAVFDDGFMQQMVSAAKGMKFNEADVVAVAKEEFQGALAEYQVQERAEEARRMAAEKEVADKARREADRRAVAKAIEDLKTMPTQEDAKAADARALQAVADTKNAVKGMDTLMAAALAYGQAMARAGLGITPASAKTELLATARAAGISSGVAAGIIDEGIDKGFDEASVAIKADPVTVLNEIAVRCVQRNPSPEQVAATAYELVRSCGMKPENLARERLLAAVGNKSRAYETVFDSAVAAAISSGAEIAATEGNAPVERVRAAMIAAAHEESRYLSIEAFERIMFEAEVLEANGRALSTERVAGEEAAVEAEIAAIRANPTLKQLRESTLKVAVPGMTGEIFIGERGASLQWQQRKQIDVRGDKVCVDIFERLCAALIEARPEYTVPVKTTLGLFDAGLPTKQVPAPAPAQRLPEGRNLLKKTWNEPQALSEGEGNYTPIDPIPPAPRRRTPKEYIGKDERGITVIRSPQRDERR